VWEAGIPIPMTSDLVMLLLGERVSAGALPLWRAARFLAGSEVEVGERADPSAKPGSTEASINSVEPSQAAGYLRRNGACPMGAALTGRKGLITRVDVVRSCPRFGGSWLGLAGWTRPRRRARRESYRDVRLLPYSCSKPYAPAWPKSSRALSEP
jgi:hypothetical protein